MVANVTFCGLYTHIEYPDDELLDRPFGNDGYLYKYVPDIGWKLKEGGGEMHAWADQVRSSVEEAPYLSTSEFEAEVTRLEAFFLGEAGLSRHRVWGVEKVSFRFAEFIHVRFFCQNGVGPLL